MDCDLVLDVVELVAAEEDMMLDIADADCTGEEQFVDQADTEEPTQSFDAGECSDVEEFPHEEVDEFEVAMVHEVQYFQVLDEEQCALGIRHEVALLFLVMGSAHECSYPSQCHRFQQDPLVCD